ncbi:protein trm32 [Phtheirospermum japonicum]|uniref:Protein trm32 n=1 Tax=Phtheirospermum japonicum TaxID=374723 RepID=A0A830C8B8_9LAMI|nr:protein trm32 [Phtheirospermum japonicum]
MAKRSKRRTSRHERDQAGCISGIINIFQFRHGRSTKRLLTDRKQTVGAGHSSNNTISPSPTEKCENLAVTEENTMPTADAAKTSVKELMEVEMFNEQGPKHTNDSEMGSEQVSSKSRNRTKKHQKKKRSSAKSSDMDFDQKNIDLEIILEELANIDQRNTNGPKHDCDPDIDVPSGGPVTVVEEKLVEAVKLFIEQRLSNNTKRFGDEANNCFSDELMDALKMLRLNKGLFLKLLQDPDSELFKHIQNFEDARLGKEPEEKPVNLKPADELSSHKNRNFFRRRTKSLESYPSGENNNKDCQSPSKIVILKPGPERSKSPETDIAERNASQFSFTEIKRKLRHAIGKERPSLQLSPKGQNGNFNIDRGENFCWSSPNRNHFYTERFTLTSPSFKKGETVSKSKDDGSESLRLGGSNIYIEAKKHLSEMVKSGDENTELTAGKNPVKPLGRILSLPEFNVSPCLSPRKHVDDMFVTAQTRLLSPRGSFKDYPSPRMQKSESQPCISGLVNSLNANNNNSLGDDREYSLEIQCFNEDNVISEDQSIVAEIEQTNELRPREEEKIVDDSCESSCNSIGGDIKNEVGNEESASPGFILHFSEDDQISSSPTVSPSQDRASTEIEDSDRVIDKIEQPSPISVLEPLFADDDISPASTIFHTVEKEIEPRHIHFEEEQQSSVNIDQSVCMRISQEDEESAFEYVEAVLLGSGLNWDEFLLRWICLCELLDPSLFDEVELFSSRPRHDQKLLFDCANEALKEVCENYFGCFTNVKPNIRPVPKGMDLIHEVWEKVEGRLFQNLRSHSLDGLVKRDLAGSRDWMNIRSDIELIVFDMEENIFDELLDEIVMSFGE